MYTSLKKTSASNSSIWIGWHARVPMLDPNSTCTHSLEYCIYCRWWNEVRDSAHSIAVPCELSLKFCRAYIKFTIFTYHDRLPNLPPTLRNPWLTSDPRRELVRPSQDWVGKGFGDSCTSWKWNSMVHATSISHVVMHNTTVWLSRDVNNFA